MSMINALSSPDIIVASSVICRGLHENVQLAGRYPSTEFKHPDDVSNGRKAQTSLTQPSTMMKLINDKDHFDGIFQYHLLQRSLFRLIRLS
jgi:hypothetical protein